MTPDQDPSATPPEPHPETPQPGQLYKQAWMFYLLLAVGGVFWVGAHYGSIPLTLFLDPGSWWIDVLLGIAAALLLIALWSLGRSRLAGMRELEDQISRLIGPLDEAEVFALAFLSGFTEEFFFRGAMQSSWGWIWATLVFGLIHTGPGKVFRLWTVYALVAGLCFALLTHYRGNIMAAVLAHMIVNGIHLRRLTVVTAEQNEA